jgi:hypothetical protein
MVMICEGCQQIWSQQQQKQQQKHHHHHHHHLLLLLLLLLLHRPHTGTPLYVTRTAWSMKSTPSPVEIFWGMGHSALAGLKARAAMARTALGSSIMAAMVLLLRVAIGDDDTSRPATATRRWRGNRR